MTQAPAEAVVDLAQEEEQRPAKRRRLPVECLICFGETQMEEGMRIRACGHFYCLDCMREYVDGAVKDRRYPVTCPVPDCRLAISSPECMGLLAPEQQAALASMETEAAVGQGVRLYCPNARCSKLLIADDKRADTPLPCPYCGERLCANCGVTWHAGMTCQAYQARPDALSSAEDRALMELGKKEGMKRCPACGVMVQRTMGCAHMKCRCGAAFCYCCGKQKGGNDPHFCKCTPAQQQWHGQQQQQQQQRPVPVPVPRQQQQQVPRQQQQVPQQQVEQRRREVRERLEHMQDLLAQQEIKVRNVRGVAERHEARARAARGKLAALEDRRVGYEWSVRQLRAQLADM
jgi:hypothetical protein